MRVVIFTEEQWQCAVDDAYQAGSPSEAFEVLVGAVNENVTEDELGAVLAWINSNHAYTISELSEARRLRDTAYATNVSTEVRGLKLVHDALRRAGITPFEGHEVKSRG